jgi:hypothetical protein
VSLWTPLASVSATVRDASLTGISLALDRAAPEIAPGTAAVVTVGDVSITATVRRADQDRPWDPRCGLAFDGSTAEVAQFLGAIADARLG